MALRSLEDHNAARVMFTFGPAKNGIACPKCGAELIDTNPSVVLTSNPPRYLVHCEACDYSGTRY